MNLISIFLTSIFVENIILSKFLGIDFLFNMLSSKKKLFGVVFATFIITIVSNLTSYFIYYNVLVPNNIEYLKTITFVIVILFIIGIVNIIIKKQFHNFAKSLDDYMPLVLSNSIILGTALLIVQNEYHFNEAFVYTLGGCAGYVIVAYVFSTINERLERSPIPINYRGLPIYLILASITAMVFTRYIIG